MINKPGNRRDLLKLLVSACASAPFLSYMPSLGAAEIPRKRLILMFSPNGTVPDEFFPSGGEYDFALKRILQPMEAIRDQILIFKGLENKTPEPGSSHQRGMGGLWTAAHLNPGTSKGGGDSDPVSWASGISIDQMVANNIGQDTRYKSLEYGIQSGSPEIRSRMCYTGNNTPIESEQNPFAAFNRLYANFEQTGNPGQQDSRSIRVASVLNSVLADFNRIRPHLSAEDRIKLEQHADSVRSIENAIQVPELGNVCQIPNQGEAIDIDADDNYPALGKLFMDMMVSAFACDQTTVASLQFSRAVGGIKHRHLGVGSGHHGISHDSHTSGTSMDNLTKINTWYAEQFTYLVTQLQNTADPSGSGSLLDNSLVVWGNELGKGDNHTRRDIPFVTAGSCQGYFRTGRYIQQSGQISHARLLTSIANAYGIPATGFGDINEGALANLT